MLSLFQFLSLGKYMYNAQRQKKYVSYLISNHMFYFVKIKLVAWQLLIIKDIHVE